MQLKTKTDCAIRVMLFLSTKKESTRREMASALGINEYYLPKIVRPLRDMNWVASATGSEGGFRIIVEPENITLLDIIETMEGKLKVSTFLDEEQTYNHNISAMNKVHQVFRRYQDQVEIYFSSITLKDLLDSGKTKKEKGNENLSKIS
jgi:Rrf2 family protein